MARTLWIAVLGLSTSCGELPAPFSVDNAFPPPNPDGSVRITYNPGADHAPVWSAASDSVYYSAQSFAPFPETAGMLLSGPRVPGPATTLLPTVQPMGVSAPFLTALAPSANAQSFAFFEIKRTQKYDCDLIASAEFELSEATRASLPQLIEATLRVRPRIGLQDAAAVAVRFPGITLDTTRHPFNLAGVLVLQVHPYHDSYGNTGGPLFRASWSPDGTRLVYSDGLNLYTWTLGAEEAIRIQNTRDAVWPAWSPDGQWIAFTRLARGPPLNLGTFRCIDEPAGRVTAVYEIVTYETTAASTVELIRPDGTDARSLGEGRAPAWTPSGAEIVFARGTSLWRSPRAGGHATVISNTTDGDEPAISRDGKWLSFARRNSRLGTSDVWVVPF